MNDQNLRAIIRQEIASQTSQNRFRLSTNNRHVHNGLDSPAISQSDIVPGLRLEGTITFAHVGQYKIATNFNPSAVWIQGNVTGDASQKFVVIANAQLGGNSFYLQPGTSNSTTVGGPSQSIIQSSTYFGSEGNGAGAVFHTVADEGHIVDVEYPLGTIHARATITKFDNQAIYVDVETLASGWSMNLSLTIT